MKIKAIGVILIWAFLGMDLAWAAGPWAIAPGSDFTESHEANDRRRLILDELEQLNLKISVMIAEIEQVREQVEEGSLVMRRVEKGLLPEFDRLVQVMETSQTRLTELIGESGGSISRIIQVSTDFAPGMSERLTRLQTEISQEAISLEPLISWMKETKQELEPMMREYEQVTQRLSEKKSSDRFDELYLAIRQTLDMGPVRGTLSQLVEQIGRTYIFIWEMVDFISHYEPVDVTRRETKRRPSPVKPTSPSPKPTEILQNVLNELGYRPKELDVDKVVKGLPSLLPTSESLREIIQTHSTDRKIHWLLLLAIHQYQTVPKIDPDNRSRSLTKERINSVNNFLLTIQYPYLPEANRLYQFVQDILKEPHYQRRLQEIELSYKMARRIIKELLRNNQGPKDIIWREHLRISERHKQQFVLTPMVFHWIQMILHRSMAANLVGLEDHYKVERELITEAVLNSTFQTSESKEAFRDILISGPQSKSKDVVDLLVSRGIKGFFEIRQLQSQIDKVWRIFSSYRNNVQRFSAIEFNSPVIVLHDFLKIFDMLISRLSPAGVEVLAQGFELTHLLESFLTSRREDSLVIDQYRQLSECIMQFQAIRDKHIKLGRLDLLAYQEIKLVQKLDRFVDQALSQMELEQDREALRTIKDKISSFFKDRSIEIHQIGWHTNQLNHDIYHLLNRLLSVLGKDSHERGSILETMQQPIVSEFLKIMNDLKWFRINLTTASQRIKEAAGKYRGFLESQISASLPEKKEIGLEGEGIVKDLLELIESLEEVKGTRKESAKVNVQQELERLMSSYGEGDTLGGLNIELLSESPTIVAEVTPSAFRKVIRNLVDNAIDAMGGRGEISIRVSHNLQKRKVFIEIQDTGTGIEPETLEKIFDSQFTTKSGGTGMGLAIVQEVVEFYNGTIEVKSRPISKYPQDHGTVFTISLPSIELISIDDLKSDPPHVLQAL